MPETTSSNFETKENIGCGDCEHAGDCGGTFEEHMNKMGLMTPDQFFAEQILNRNDAESGINAEYLDSTNSEQNNLDRSPTLETEDELIFDNEDLNPETPLEENDLEKLDQAELAPGEKTDLLSKFESDTNEELLLSSSGRIIKRADGSWDVAIHFGETEISLLANQAEAEDEEALENKAKLEAAVLSIIHTGAAVVKTGKLTTVYVRTGEIITAKTYERHGAERPAEVDEQIDDAQIEIARIPTTSEEIRFREEVKAVEAETGIGLKPPVKVIEKLELHSPNIIESTLASMLPATPEHPNNEAEAIIETPRTSSTVEVLTILPDADAPSHEQKTTQETTQEISLEYPYIEETKIEAVPVQTIETIERTEIIQDIKEATTEVQTDQKTVETQVQVEVPFINTHETSQIIKQTAPELVINNAAVRVKQTEVQEQATPQEQTSIERDDNAQKNEILIQEYEIYREEFENHLTVKPLWGGQSRHETPEASIPPRNKSQAELEKLQEIIEALHKGKANTSEIRNIRRPTAQPQTFSIVQTAQLPDEEQLSAAAELTR